MAKSKKAEGKPAESKDVAANPGKAKPLKAKPGTGKGGTAEASPQAKIRGASVKAGSASRGAAAQERLIPGQYFLRADPIVANADRLAIEVQVENAGDRPIQVGSHFHFFEVNRALRFDRKRGYGMRLDIPAGTAVRFEPGQAKKVALIPLGGERQVWGLNGLVNGPLK
jgi:urease subunit beta